MIDRPLITPTYSNGHDTGLGSAVVTLDTMPSTVDDLPDGGAVVTFGDVDEERRLASAPFEANLAEFMAENELDQIASQIRSAVDEDRTSRADWERALTNGMELLGIKITDRDVPWVGACGVVHPMILEAAVRFQSKSITRLFPPTGPADAKLIGDSDESRVAQAKRVATDINYWLVEKMPEYRDETEQLLFAVPTDGSAFKKIFYDPILKRPVAQYVPANDFLMPYGFANLETCPRYTHVMKKSYGDVHALQLQGFYRDVPLMRGPIQLDRVEEKVVQLGGMRPSYAQSDLLTLWETHLNLAIEDPETASPYVVTLEFDSNRVLSIKRNWREGDPERKKVMSFVHYRYVPWKGAYGLGLIHLIGGIGKSSTTILRQLVDAGTLSNLPGGLKSRQLRIKGDDDPIHPGEFRDVDVPAGKILDSIAFIPYKEPSAVLFQLLQMLVEEGKSFASIAELDISTSAQNAPVGTILALLERATEVITAVQSRMHTALARELALVAEIIRDHGGPDYDYDPANNVPRSMKQSDYNDQVSIVPVSDPAASTMAQRVMVYQSALQLSAQAPQLYNLPLLHRSMLEVLGVDNADQIVPDKTATEPMDPVAENMALLTSKPVKAFQWQDHQSHLQVHQAAMQDPKIMQALSQNPLAPSIQSAAFAHINEHLAFLYRSEIEKQMGVSLPPLGEKLPPEVEEQLSGVVAAAAQKLLEQDKAQAQQQQQGQQQQDPVVQQQQQELQLKQEALQQKGQTDQAKLQLEGARTQQKAQIEAAKIASAEKRTAMEVSAENQRHALSEHAQTHRDAGAEHAESTRHLMSQRIEQEKIHSAAEQAAMDDLLESGKLPSGPPPPEEGLP